ncbi:conserved hypothetical protein [Hyella patelloides LEGE 07179]|uniref:Uncharacterized protein n=1 Tax=Hyella patelloides LEGE 07179 TaxID=945734 RepID=A0A563VP91_9CYAN|nr:hypothetical protein [Hyella patelloides]VEP13155.1 conserved hypothetical protein [Hyella patelloides LEGE 07179]
MYLTIGETKLLVGQFGEQKTEKLELNFEYLFDSYGRYRRFAQVIADTEGKTLKIKIKSEFKNPSDCAKLSRLLIGVQKLITQDNLNLLSSILELKSGITPQDFIKQQADLIKHFL